MTRARLHPEITRRYSQNGMNTRLWASDGDHGPWRRGLSNCDLLLDRLGRCGARREKGPPVPHRTRPAIRRYASVSASSSNGSRGRGATNPRAQRRALPPTRRTSATLSVDDECPSLEFGGVGCRGDDAGRSDESSRATGASVSICSNSASTALCSARWLEGPSACSRRFTRRLRPGAFGVADSARNMVRVRERPAWWGKFAGGPPPSSSHRGLTQRERATKQKEGCGTRRTERLDLEHAVQWPRRRPPTSSGPPRP